MQLQVVLDVIAVLAGAGLTVSLAKLGPVILYRVRMLDPRERARGGRPPARQPRAYWVALSVATMLLIASAVSRRLLGDTSPPIVRFQQIDLRPMATLQHYPSYHVLDPLEGTVILAGIPFVIPGPAEGVIHTQHHLLPDLPTQVEVPIDLPGVLRVHLLLNGGYVQEVFLNVEVGHFALRFADGSELRTPIIAGRCLREGWRFIYEQGVGVVTEIGGDLNCRNVFGELQARSGKPANAIIDLMSVPIPPAQQQERLLSLTVVDSSVEDVGSTDPAIIIIAVTVELSA